ncbi:MAG TPA: hypothetical protein DCF68_22115 [Cyanothece sp. UBA12306]|nr:hypothetical protein [Cyanothece sp. UBA12306]
MLVPLISLVLGSFLLLISFLSYTNNPILKNVQWLFKLKSNLHLFWGINLIALTLILGIFGYLNYIDASLLRPIRYILAIMGLGLISLHLLRKFIPLKPFLKFLKIKNILTIFSVAILVSIFLIAFFDANYGGDAFMYHVPFAARIWGIISPEQYTFEDNIENRLLGFPLLTNFLQGFFWKILNRPEATNLVCYFSLIVFISYLTSYLKIPFYLSTIALLAVPMVHMHAARSYIDLPSNVGVSILILTTYLLYANRVQFNHKTFLKIVLSGAIAANSKFQLIPIVFLVLCFLFPQVINKYWKINGNGKKDLRALSKTLLLCFLASTIIFATPIKNTLVYQNPFYPVKIEIAGKVLNHNETKPNFMHQNLRNLPPPLRWGKSILEIDAFDDRRPWKWTLAMDFISWDQERFGIGGYFGGYVIFNLILFLYIVCTNRDCESKIAALLLVIMTPITSILPQSYELRYYMYWMIVLVSLNCYLVCSLVDKSSKNKQWINPKNFALIATGFMLVFMAQTRYFFTIPEFASFESQLKRTDIIDQNILRNIKDGEKVCLVHKVPNTFLYNSYFHPPRNYSVKAEFNLGEEFVQEQCKGRRIIE